MDTTERFVPSPQSLLGQSPSSSLIQQYLHELAKLASVSLSTPEVKVYTDALYINHYPLGLSFMFVARDGSKKIKESDVAGDRLALDSVDIFNMVASDATSASNSSKAYTSHPVSTLMLSLKPSNNGKPRPNELELTPSSIGKDIVSCLGEPDRKGGGAGPSSGSIGIWCEWTRDGIMIEFGGSDARGPQAWERGKDAKWKVLTIFRSPVA